MMDFQLMIALCNRCEFYRICDHIGLKTENCPFPFNRRESEEDNETFKK